MRTRLRILVVSYLPPAGGGIATWAAILRDGAPAGHCQFLFESVAPKSRDGRGSLPHKLLDATGLAGRLIRRLVRDQPDVVHLNTCLSPLGVWRDLLIVGLASAWSVPILVHYRGSLPALFDRLPTPSRTALRWLMNIADVHVGVTRESESLLRQFCGSDRTAYIPNFIEDRHLRSPSDLSAKHRERRRARAAYVGRLSADKGTLDLLQVAGMLPDIDFVLIGELSPGLRYAVETAPANVIARGPLPREEVMSSLRDADLFVFPSRREGFPNAVLEAMAAGLPVVATRVGAIPDMVAEGFGGYLVPPSDPSALAAAIRRLAEDPERSRRMGAHNRNVSLERFRFDTVFDALTAIYERIVRSGRSRGSLFRPLSGTATIAAPSGREADP